MLCISFPQFLLQWPQIPIDIHENKRLLELCMAHPHANCEMLQGYTFWTSCLRDFTSGDLICPLIINNQTTGFFVSISRFHMLSLRSVSVSLLGMWCLLAVNWVFVVSPLWPQMNFDPNQPGSCENEHMYILRFQRIHCSYVEMSCLQGLRF